MFLASSKRSTLLAKHVQNQNPSSSINLIPLCPTRWIERHDSILRFTELLVIVGIFLKEIAHDSETDFEISNKASTLHSALCSAKFICTIYIMERV